MKNTNSLRTQKAIARFGLAARHPLCQAWLRRRECRSEYSNHERCAAEVWKLLEDTKRIKKEAISFYRQFSKEEKWQKESIEAAAHLRKINEHLAKLKTCHQAQVKHAASTKDSRDHYEIEFVLERLKAKDTKDTQALEALKYLKKTVAESMSDGQKRVFGILKMLRDKTIKATWAKNGSVAGYWQAASGGERPLSDEFWQERFTVMDFRSGLEAIYGSGVAGDKEGKEVRRALKELGIQPAKDIAGRKWKPPIPVKQQKKKPRGRPRIRPELVYTGNTEGAEGTRRAISGNRVNTTGHVLERYCQRDTFKYGNTSYGGLSSLVESARKDTAEVKRETRAIMLRRGGNLGRYCYE